MDDISQMPREKFRKLCEIIVMSPRSQLYAWENLLGSWRYEMKSPATLIRYRILCARVQVLRSS